MSQFEIKPGQKIHCKELNTGSSYSGIFSIDRNDIITRLISYSGDFEIDEKEAVFLRTENNAIVSLYNNISLGKHILGLAPGMTTYKQEIYSYAAVVGHDCWKPSDKVRRITFLVDDSKRIFRHRAKMSSLAEKFGSECESRELLSTHILGITVRVWYCATYSAESEFAEDIWPQIQLDLDEGCSVFEYMDFVQCIVHYLSLSLGTYMQPSDIRICGLSHAEMIAAVEKNAYPGDYMVAYIWPEIETNDADMWMGGSLFNAWDNEQLDALTNCLFVWVERFRDWQKPNELMARALKLRNEISGTRLINALNWFEEIPLAKTKPAIPDECISEIAAAAANKASEMGFAEMEKRISGSLKSIKSESHKNRFERLLSDFVRVKFSYSIVDAAIIEHLESAIRFRGKCAHGHFSARDDAEFRAFAKSIHAVEALCFLLTASGLPLSNEGVRRAGMNPFVKGYHYCLSP